MEQEELHLRLKQLHQELQQVKTLDEDNRALLQKIEDEIQSVLAAREDEPFDKGSGEGLLEGIERLQAAHPDLALTLGQLAQILSKMGI